MQAHLNLKQTTHPELGIDSQRLRLEVETSVPDLLHVKITDTARKRWEVPQSLLHTSAEHINGTPSLAAAAQGKPPLVRAHKGRGWSSLGEVSASLAPSFRTMNRSRACPDAGHAEPCTLN